LTNPLAQTANANAQSVGDKKYQSTEVEVATNFYAI